MSATLFACDGGQITLSEQRSLVVSRENGGNLVILPPRDVWERSELTARELTLWSFLVAATGRAMLDTLPQLEGGCINYWEAGNWALNDAAEPRGRKTAKEFRHVHLHLLGRSRCSTSPAWTWGESPRFPAFEERYDWASTFEPLRAQECAAIVAQVEARLRSHYGMQPQQIEAWAVCLRCGYPAPTQQLRGQVGCAQCRGEE